MPALAQVRERTHVVDLEKDVEPKLSNFKAGTQPEATPRGSSKARAEEKRLRQRRQRRRQRQQQCRQKRRGCGNAGRGGGSGSGSKAGRRGRDGSEAAKQAAEAAAAAAAAAAAKQAEEQQQQDEEEEEEEDRGPSGCWEGNTAVNNEPLLNCGFVGRSVWRSAGWSSAPSLHYPPPRVPLREPPYSIFCTKPHRCPVRPASSSCAF
jgi:hypothetical protein